MRVNKKTTYLTKNIAIKITTLLLSILLMQCCNIYYTWFSLYNNSGNPVYCYISIHDEVFYPDTALPTSSKNLIKVDKEHHFNRIVNIFRTLDNFSIFFLDADIVEKYDWEYIREEYKILKRYDISSKYYNTSKDVDITINYPPTESERNIKQFPPFEEDSDD